MTNLTDTEKCWDVIGPWLTPSFIITCIASVISLVLCPKAYRKEGKFSTHYEKDYFMLARRRYDRQLTSDKLVFYMLYVVDFLTILALLLLMPAIF